MDSNHHYGTLCSTITCIKKASVVLPVLSGEQVDRIIEMAWEDRTTFDAIHFQFGLNEAEVKALMKENLKFSSYKLWRSRVDNCRTKHAFKRLEAINRFKCNSQRIISQNKLSKRR